MKEIMKNRKIRVRGITCDGCAQTVTEAMTNLKGVQTVEVVDKETVIISYDLQRINLMAIEKKLSDIGYPPTSSLLSKFGRGWIHFTEQNEYDNDRAEVALCCPVPEKKSKYK